MITCVRLPHFAASLEERAHPDLRGQPFVLVDDTGQQIVGVSRQAARAGVRAGMGLVQAHAQCAGLHIRPMVHSRTQHAFENLLDALTTFTAQVEPEDGLELRADARRWREMTFLHPTQLDDYPAVTCYLDLGKLKPDETPDLAQQVHRFVWEQTRIPAKLGMSSGKFPARVAATSVNTGDLLVVPDGQEGPFLAGFTVALLPVDGETLRQLDLLGWHTLGDVATQPVAALLNRFGKQGRTMHRLANGRDTSPVSPYQPSVVTRASRQLDEPLMDWGRLEAVLREMVETAAAGLLADGQTVRHITLVLSLENGTALERAVVLRQPTGSPRHIRETVRDMAQSLAVTCGVVDVELALSDVTPAVPRQLSLFDRPAVPQAHLNGVLKDLVARYGDAHFYWVRAVARDARLPERRYRWEKADRS
jgi:nucleotidyltransferase/DNA polymerase involved in DNA repair